MSVDLPLHLMTDLVEALDDDEREVINGLYWERTTVRTIAGRLNVGVATVGRIHERALAHLKEGAAGLMEAL